MIDPQLAKILVTTLSFGASGLSVAATLRAWLIWRHDESGSGIGESAAIGFLLGTAWVPSMQSFNQWFLLRGPIIEIDEGLGAGNVPFEHRRPISEMHAVGPSLKEAEVPRGFFLVFDVVSAFV